MASPTVIGTNSTVVVSGTQTSLTLSHTVPSSGQNRCLIVVVGGVDMTSGGVTYNSVSMTKAINYGVNSEFISVWYLVNPSTGTNDVVATTPSSNRTMMHAITVQDAAASPLGNTGTNSHVNSATAPNVIVTTGTNNSAVLACFGSDPQTTAITIPAGETRQTETNNSSGGGDRLNSVTLDGGQGTAGSVSMTTTTGANCAFDAVAVELKYLAPTPGSSASINRGLSLLGVGQ